MNQDQKFAEAVAEIVRTQDAYGAAVVARNEAERAESEAWSALERARQHGREVMSAAGVANAYASDLVR